MFCLPGRLHSRTFSQSHLAICTLDSVARLFHQKRHLEESGQMEGEYLRGSDATISVGIPFSFHFLQPTKTELLVPPLRIQNTVLSPRAGGPCHGCLKSLLPCLISLPSPFLCNLIMSRGKAVLTCVSTSLSSASHRIGGQFKFVLFQRLYLACLIAIASSY